MTEQQQPEHPAAQDVPLGGVVELAPGTDVTIHPEAVAVAPITVVAQDDPNAAASPAVASSASDTPSSAPPASPGDVTPEGSAFASAGNEALKSIHTLRTFLWTFEAASVAHLHAELDKLKAIFE
ncbi:hypothetical protein ACN4GH_01840 [Burkholderia pseudomallei]